MPQSHAIARSPLAAHAGVLVLLAGLLLLSACEVQSGIQSRYVAQQTECRGEAEDRMDATPNTGNMSAKQRNAQLVDNFSTCMIKGGWHVARPVKNPTVPPPPGTNPREASLPAQPLPGQPSDVITAARTREPVPAASSPANEPVRTQPSLLQPSPGQPALSAPATTQQMPAGAYQPPATYQRITPPVTGTGTGTPGRNF